MRRLIDFLTGPASVLVALLVSAGPAHAQFGLKAGAGRSTIVFSPEAGSPKLTQVQQRRDLAGGVYLLLPGNRVGGWQLEGLVIEKGAKNLLRRDDEMRLVYFEIPALVHFDVLQRNRRALFVLAGPSVVFPVHASYEDDGVREDIKEDIHKVDVGLHLGAGLEIGRAAIDARYIWGLRTVFHDGDIDGTFKNRTFIVTAGVRLAR